ncbi:MAG TPA: DUF6544 family protein [Chloroflexota bacterium]|nr:DUF6544 family protein [Chloroflexota bacterium]
MRRLLTASGTVAAGLMLAAAATAAVRRARWRAATTALTARLLGEQPVGPPGVVRFDALGDLPAPVQRYFRRVLTDGQPLVRSARLVQAGQFRVQASERGWRPLRAVQIVATAPPGFLWDARIAVGPGLSVRVRDAYVDGAASMYGEMAALFTLIDQHDRGELRAGALQRYLAEAAWFPTALLPSQGVAWTPIDDRAALATLADGATTVSLEFRFNDADEIASIFTPARYREVGGRYEPTPWLGEYRSYREQHGMAIPTEAEVRWVLPDGDYPYARPRIAKIDYAF